MRFGLGVDGEHTLEEIGEKFGISRERVRQIETTALQTNKGFDMLGGFKAISGQLNRADRHLVKTGSVMISCSPAA